MILFKVEDVLRVEQISGLLMDLPIDTRHREGETVDALAGLGY